MTEYALTKVRQEGDADIYELRLPDGSFNRFIYTGAQKAVDPSDEAFARCVAISLGRAQRDSAYVKARR